MQLLMKVVPFKSDVFFAISDPTRRALLQRLGREGEKSVTELFRPLSITQPAVSKHLRCLLKAGLVRRRTAGRMRLYRINAGQLRQVHDWVSQFERYWDERLDALGQYLERKRKPPG